MGIWTATGSVGEHSGGDGDAGERAGVGVGGDKTGGVNGGDLTASGVITVAGDEGGVGEGDCGFGAFHLFIFCNNHSTIGRYRQE